MEILTSLTSAQLKDWVIFVAGCAGLAWYYLCLFDLGLQPTAGGQQPGGFRQFQSLSLTTIGVSLATYVGYVVGLPSHAGSVAKASAAATSAVAAAAVPASSASAVAAGVAAATTTVSPLQTVSAGLYLLSLLIAVGLYWRAKDATEPAVTGLARSLLGFVAGVFSISLNGGS